MVTAIDPLLDFDEHELYRCTECGWIGDKENFGESRSVDGDAQPNCRQCRNVCDLEEQVTGRELVDALKAANARVRELERLVAVAEYCEGCDKNGDVDNMIHRCERCYSDEIDGG